MTSSVEMPDEGAKTDCLSQKGRERRSATMIRSSLPSSENSLGRLQGVDILRGMCVLLVVMHHIHLRFVLNHFDVDNFLPRVVNQLLFWSGYYAVITFFVISGFLITSLSVGRWDVLAAVDVRGFYSMRLARIAPCLLFLLGILSALHLAGVTDFTIKPERASLGRALIAALTFHVNWLEGHRGYLPGSWDILWSLSVEEAFYLLFPLACILIGSERKIRILLCCVLIVGPVNRTLLGEQDPWRDYAYLSCSDGIAFGCLAALICIRKEFSVLARQIALISGTTIAIAVVLLCNEDSHTGLARFGLNITLLELAVALMLVALGNGWKNATLARGTAWLRSMGRASYEVYLFHMLVISSLMNKIRSWHPDAFMIPLWYALMLALSMALGWLLSRFYSEPLNRWVRKQYPATRSAAARPVVTT